MRTPLILSKADFRKSPMGIYGKRRKGKGISLYCCNGGWNVGNGELHCNYEPVPEDQPMGANEWH